MLSQSRLAKRAIHEQDKVQNLVHFGSTFVTHDILDSNRLVDKPPPSTTEGKHIFFNIFWFQAPKAPLEGTVSR